MSHPATSDPIRRIEVSELSCIAGSTRGVAIPNDTFFLSDGGGYVGDVVVGRIVSVGTFGRVIQTRSGRYVHLRRNDLVVVVLGNRHSTTRIYGSVPAEGIPILKHTSLDLLTVGGVVGVCEDSPSSLGNPTKVEVLGKILVDGNCVNTVANARTSTRVSVHCPLLLIGGTAADVGKTTFAANFIHYIVRTRGLSVAACKLTGTGNLNDVFLMQDAGAVATRDFVDFGLPTTYGLDRELVVSVARAVLNDLADLSRPALIVAELGGDIIGGGVADILVDTEVQRAASGLIVVPSDVIAGFGAETMLRQSGFALQTWFGLPIRNATASRLRASSMLSHQMLDSWDDKDLAILADALELTKPVERV